MKRPPDGAGSKTLRIPHPRGAWRDVERARRARPFLHLGVFLSVSATLAGSVAFGLVGAAAGAAVTLALGFAAWNRTRAMTIVVDDKRVTLPDGSSMPKGEGTLVVSSYERTTPKGEKYCVYTLSHSISGMFEPGCPNPISARACMEGLSFAGGWPIRWCPLGGPEELREPAALDVPFAVREALEPTLPPPMARPASALYDVEPASGDVIHLRYGGGWLSGSNASPLGAMAVAGLMGLALSMRVGVELPAALFLGAVALFPLSRPEAELSSSGITLRYRVLGGLPLVTRRLSSLTIESLYIEAMPRLRLVAAGDGFHATLAYGIDGAEAEWLRGVVARVLVGQPGATTALGRKASSAATNSPAHDSGSEQVCPACAHVGLERIGGALDEERCPACGGRFLSHLGTERLVEGELGITRDVLRDLTNYFAGERRFCPSCRSRTSAVRLKGTTADLCQGCGGLWLDPGELSQLSGGRYEG